MIAVNEPRLIAVSRSGRKAHTLGNYLVVKSDL